MLAKTFLPTLIACSFLSMFSHAQVRIERDKKGELLTSDVRVSAPNYDRTQRIELPEFVEFCLYSPDDKRFPAGANRLFPWVGKDNLHEIAEKKDILMSLKADRRYQIGIFKLKNGEYLCLMALPSDKVCSWFEVSDPNGKILDLKTGSMGNTNLNESNAILCAIGHGASATKAIDHAWEQAFSSKKFSQYAQVREKKVYPEMFQYLGWCSWEQYKFDINEKLLKWATQELNQSTIPVRWMLIDDGFQNINQQKLVDFNTDKKKFPNGMLFLPKLKNDKIKWMGVWNCYYGYWQGISPQHQFNKEISNSFVESRDIKHKGNHSLLTGKDANSTQKFYEAYMSKVKADGYDFVKIDGQADYLDYVQKRFSNPVEMNNWCSIALEKACRKHQLALTNCMTLGPLTMYRSLHSAISRCSVDYKVNNVEMGYSHLWQSYANALWMFPLVWPDHDMFHSSDPKSGRMMAVSKALSGGPVYLSDAPNHLNAETIMPLIEHDGKILRPKTTAVPLSDSIMMNPKMSSKPYRVAAQLNDEGMAVAAYHFADEKLYPVQKGQITTDDVNECLDKMPRAGMVYWDFYHKKGGVLDQQGYHFELPKGTDRLVLLAPIKSDWAIFGSANKFLPQSMFDQAPTLEKGSKNISFSMKESGPILIWTKESSFKVKPHCELKSLGDGFWILNYPSSPSKLQVKLIRD